MGNDISKSSERINPKGPSKKLKKLILKEYPWLDDIQESMLITDMNKEDHPIVYANDDFHQMTQYTKEEVLGFNCRFLQGKHTNPHTVSKIKEAIINREELEVEILNYRKDGTPFLNNFLLLPLHTRLSSPNEVTHYLAIQKDVTYLMQENDPIKWKSSHIALWLERAGYGEFVGPFIKNEIKGEEFLAMDSTKLSEIGIIDPSIRIKLLRLIEFLNSEGPSFVYELENDVSMYSMWDSYSSTSRSPYNSVQSTSECYEIEDDAGVLKEVDLHHPRQTAYWKRKRFLDSSDEEINTSKLMEKIQSEVITVRCEMWNSELEQSEGKQEDMLFGELPLLFALRNQLKIYFNLQQNPFQLSVLVGNTWKAITSQQTYSSMMKYVLKKDKIVNLRVSRMAGEEMKAVRELLAFPRDRDACDGLDLDLYLKDDDNQLKIHFLIPREEVSKRVLLFDAMHRVGELLFFHSVESIWSSLSTLDEREGFAFVIPCSSNGKLLSTQELDDFMFYKQCEQLLATYFEEEEGELPVGKIIIAHYGSNYLILPIISRVDPMHDKGTPYSYYTTFRNMIAAVDQHNTSSALQSKNPVILSNGSENKGIRIANILFPVYFPSPAEGSRSHPETFKFGIQAHIALASYSQWKYCKRKKQSVDEYRKSIMLFEKRLRRKSYKNYMKRSQKTFDEYLTSGDLSIRGLLNEEEIRWLVEACSLTGGNDSANKRLQRLANVSLAALVSEKYFKTGVTFQNKLREVVAHNRTCLETLLRMASTGGISLCERIEMEELGRKVRFAAGGSSTLYKANWRDRTVAVKVFNESEKESAVYREITLMGLLKHQNILPVLAWGTTLLAEEDTTRIFCVFPYAEKESLFSILRKANAGGEYPFVTRFQLMTQIVDGLSYIHSLGLIHRDFKSLNIMLTRDDKVLIGDVGAARVIDTKMTKNTGTVCWMAPEMFTSSDYTEKIDIYSLGMVFYEIVSNKVPFDGLSVFEVPQLVLKGERPSFPSNISKSWVKFIQSMWHHKAVKRPTMAQIAETLASLADIPFLDPNKDK